MAEVIKKRKLATLTLERKMKIIEAVEAGGRKKQDIAAEFNIPVSTLSTILKNKEKIMSSVVKWVKRQRKSDYPDVEKYTFQWFLNCRHQNIPINGPLIREKATQFARSLGHLKFAASNGWLGNFKKRHGIYFKAMYGESREVGDQTYDLWKDVDQVWTQEETDFLISLVQTQNAIYDQNNPEHHNKETIDKIWQQIGLELNRTSESCLKKWQVLYTGYQKRKNSQKLNANKTIKKWPFFASLDFLKDYIQNIPNPDRDLSVHKLNHLIGQSSEVRLSNPEQNYSTEKIFFNEPNSEEFVSIKTEIKDEDTYTDMQNHNECDMESSSPLDNGYMDNVTDNNYASMEMESSSKVDFDQIKLEANIASKSNSMELFLLSLVEDASSLSKPAQREFKSKTLALLHSLQ